MHMHSDKRSYHAFAEPESGLRLYDCIPIYIFIARIGPSVITERNIKRPSRCKRKLRAYIGSQRRIIKKICLHGKSPS